MLGKTALLRARLVGWYARQRRDLPWRVRHDAPAGATPDPYYVLVSEAMLQQTQVATAIPYFKRFIRRFPTLRALASARPQEVLRLWQGLGYYSRARRLLHAAQTVVRDLGGRIPSEVEQLLKLPGIGRYTAGAIASLAFDRRAPTLDGNVTRVLCRLDAVKADPHRPAIRQLLWRRAEEILPQKRIGDFNSALMELGATVCTPRRPACSLCPIRAHCQASHAGIQHRIPPARRLKPRAVERRWILCIRRRNRWLIEQRPPDGRWPSMWQFPTLRADDAAPTATHIQAYTGLAVTGLRLIGTVAHSLTHRRYQFDAFFCRAAATSHSLKPANARAWIRPDQLSDYPLSKPQLTTARMLREIAGRSQ